ncbi:MAG TPA: glycosyltransferase [Thermomicrobiales bacterium]|nr:glycosyltransferase [Thermomicrobiales bacterium]
MPDEPRERAATEDRDYYNRDYYDYYNGLGPYTRERWLPFFRQVAAGIVADSHPRTSIEYGCAKGFLVETLREAGVEAYGIDFSPHAIAEVYEPLRPYCRVGDVREAPPAPWPRRYDVAICMEVLEHLDPRDALTAIRTLADAADVVYFSSNPDEEFPEATHVNVQPAAYWEDLFAQAGMVRDRGAEPGFIADWALKFVRKPVDVIIPVHNSPGHLRRCVDSLYRHTDPALFHLYLVDDASDAHTAALLDEIAARPNATLLRRETNQGFVRAVNDGLDAARGPYAVLLNSDTIVTAGWLERLLAPAVADPTVGLASPLTNNGANLSVTLPPGYGYADTAALVARRGQRRYPGAMTVVGYCLLITRRLIEAIGGLDPIFGRGYVEEADYQFRARAAGFRAVIVDDCYVYHTGEASFGDYLPHWLRNYPIFEARWGAEFTAALARYEAEDPLGYLRDPDGAIPAPPDLDYDVVFSLPPTMAGVGGMIVVVELVNRLILRGLRATVAHTGPWAIEAECLFAPLGYASEADFVAHMPRTRVLVATGYDTVAAVVQICKTFGCEPAYFIQDYEGYFDDAARLSDAAATYEQIPTRIAVSRWVQDLLREQHGLDSALIPPGVALDDFYPRPVAIPELDAARKAGKFLVFGLLRHDDRRGAPYLLEVARRLEDERPEILFVLGGHNAPPERPNILGVGLLGHREMARYLAACDAVLDTSLYQGFGLLGLEALASGAAAVLTDSGGCREYAEPDVNCLLVEPRDVRAMAGALARLRADPALRRRLGAAGRATTARFAWPAVAERHVGVYATLGARARLDERRYALAGRRRPCAAAPTPALVALYRCFDGLDHLYTADPGEAARAGYAVEGPAFALFAEPDEDRAPVHRLRHPRTGDHLYTLRPEEGLAAGYRDEGRVGYAAPDERPGLLPLYRAYRPPTRDHLYSLDPEECARGGYRPEGIVGYVPPLPATAGDQFAAADTPARRGLARRARLAPRVLRAAAPAAAPPATVALGLAGGAAWLAARRRARGRG